MAVLNINAQSALVISSKFMSSKYIVACKRNSFSGRFTTASAASTHQPRKLNRVEANDGNLKVDCLVQPRYNLQTRIETAFSRLPISRAMQALEVPPTPLSNPRPLRF
ncbi:hypothetical protein CIHG_07156 [Coccidioides immitis H538.4]|uniref:Uncharacterized protein n=3 Tax=Coccidioides immitis TaxID=5501 RepID=A0A0J8QNW1_COCIT|nr:hypothetical protein CIRG_08668 [Coccidioides immitis RMSCC 2394]KMU74141.1 hypothetical protein CISG_04070 [Coccidioides immitis RMSCC 3703]KMU89222.1 hypothetical protein CIHG_07156 [Coccidioides immitis H538.4]